MSVLNAVTQSGSRVDIEWATGSSTQNFGSEAEATQYAADMQAKIGQDLPRAFEGDVPQFARAGA